MMRKQEIELIRDYTHQGVEIPKGTRVLVVSGVALTWEKRKVCKIVNTKKRARKSESAKDNNPADEGT